MILLDLTLQLSITDQGLCLRSFWYFKDIIDIILGSCRLYIYIFKWFYLCSVCVCMCECLIKELRLRSSSFLSSFSRTMVFSSRASSFCLFSVIRQLKYPAIKRKGIKFQYRKITKRCMIFFNLLLYCYVKMYSSFVFPSDHHFEHSRLWRWQENKEIKN